MSSISTHILDVTQGRPAGDVEIVLYRGEEEVARGRTNADGRMPRWDADPGIYKLRFETMAYFDRQSLSSLYPFVEVHFEVAADGDYHIPLLLSPFGYSTYRGS
jgi:5-hydroxyisourate hydrolase